MKIIASAQMKDVFRRLKRENRLGENMAIASPPPQLRRYTPRGFTRPAPTRSELQAATASDPQAIGLAPTGTLERPLRDALIDGITGYIDSVERVVMRRKSLADQAAPLADKPPEEPRNPTDPTPEWVSKHQGILVKQPAGKGPVRPLKRYQAQSFIEQHGHTLPPEIELAIARFLQDSEYHVRIRTADLNSNGGGSGGRLGGLGNCPQHVRDGHARHDWLERQLKDNRLFFHVLEKLLYRTQARWDGRAFNLEDFGKLLWPALNDQNALRYSTKTAVMAFGAELLKLYASPQCPRVRWINEDERRLEAQA